MENNLTNTKANKENTLVVASQREYDKNRHDFLKTKLFEILKRDPTKKFNDTVKNGINSNMLLVMFTSRDECM